VIITLQNLNVGVHDKKALLLMTKKLSGFYTVRFTLLQLTVAGSSRHVI